jgi:uncharacterized membrane protein HdeD (DUF308 family)
MMFLRHWWAMALRGVVAFLFGLVALLWPHLTLTVLVLFFGAFALVSGLFAVIAAFGDRGLYGRWWVLLIEGLVGIAVGLITFFWPAVTALALLFLIAAWAIVTGILEITTAVWMHRAVGNEWMLLLGGIASVIFGLLLAVLPGVGLLALTWVIGIYAIVFGILLLMLAFQWRKLARI